MTSSSRHLNRWTQATVNVTSSLEQKNVNFEWLQLIVFPEIEYDKIDNIKGVNISLCFISPMLHPPNIVLKPSWNDRQIPKSTRVNPGGLGICLP